MWVECSGVFTLVVWVGMCIVACSSDFVVVGGRAPGGIEAAAARSSFASVSFS